MYQTILYCIILDRIVLYWIVVYIFYYIILYHSISQNTTRYDAIWYHILSCGRLLYHILSPGGAYWYCLVERRVPHSVYSTRISAESHQGINSRDKQLLTAVEVHAADRSMKWKDGRCEIPPEWRGKVVSLGLNLR